MRRTQGKRKTNLNPSHCDVTAGPIIPRSSRSLSNAVVAAFTPTLPSACHYSLPHQIRVNLAALWLAAHASTQCTVERRLSRSANGIPRARARQATTTRVVVRVVHCAVQHEQFFQPPPVSTPTLRLTLRAPLSAHQARPSRTRSDARLYLALLFPRPQRRRLWYLLRRCRPSLNPSARGSCPSLGAARPHRQPACRGYITPPAQSPFLVVQPASFDDPASGASNTSFASASRPAPPPPLRAPSAYTGASSPLAS
ncbi:hypothetical protein B0H14DRAFT_3611811 [Mycena olivaceomarginata]|nr:hypothetical protein B0H14DRAFT_3611811 [Mycena olivaceomarginata]